MLIILFLLLVAIPLIILFLPYQSKNELSNCPPGPKGLPLIGNLHQFDPLKPHICLAKLAKIYGPIMTLRLGSAPAVVVQSAETAKEILQTQDLNFCSKPPMVGAQRLSYNGLDIAFSPYNKYFREIKKICVVHLFSSKRVQSFAPVRQYEVSRLIEKIASLSTASKVVDLSDLLMSFACSNICSIALGKRYADDEGSNRSKFHRLLNEAQALFIAFFFSDYLPSLGWLDKLTGQPARLEKVFSELDAFYEEIINDHLDPSKPKSEQEDFIDVLLHLRKDRSFAFELTLDHIKAVLMNIIIAGTDTSAAMVIWAMTELVKNPTVMTKLQEEIRNAAGNKKYIAEDDLSKLEYFHAVVKETFRLHPAAPLLIVREAHQKCRVQGYDTLPKTLVYVNVWAIGRDPKCWKDAEKFIPEKFLGNLVDFRGRDFELLPFGAGRRMCPGMLLGLANFELALASMLYSFDWVLPAGVKKEDIDIDTLPGLATHKKNPLCLMAHKFSSSHCI